VARTSLHDLYRSKERANEHELGQDVPCIAL
jgi:hypothetical protein